jgi:hypothetical protein
VAKTKSEMFTLIGANLPDNTSGQITPSAVREVFTQLADSALYAAAGVKEVEVLRAPSVATQLPTALGTPLQLVFGGAQNSASNPVMLNAAGLVTFNTAGNYAVRIKLQCGRAGATGVVTLASRILLAGAQYGSSAAVRLDNANTIIPSESRVVMNVTAGQTLAIQIVRDSVDSSINAGGVYALQPATSGWIAAPSALLVVSRLEPV